MWKFLVDLIRRSDVTRTVVVMDSEELGQTRRYQIRPRRMLTVWGGSLLLTGLVVAVLFAFSPLREVIPGYGTEKLRRSARVTAVRLRALQDSVAVQRQYIERLQKLITGEIRPEKQSDPAALDESPAAATRVPHRRNSEAGTTSTQEGKSMPPALFPSKRLGAEVLAGGANLSMSPSFPVKPPVKNGFPTRGFDAQTGHYGLDLAVSKGAFVRAIGGGSVVLADWTRDGGYTIAVQHGGGYLSVYKHNKRLLKQIGDRVKAREPLAVSGNTGKMTTGPHLHFELWRNGLALDPQSYITGW